MNQLFFCVMRHSGDVCPEHEHDTYGHCEVNIAPLDWDRRCQRIAGSLNESTIEFLSATVTEVLVFSIKNARQCKLNAVTF